MKKLKFVLPRTMDNIPYMVIAEIRPVINPNNKNFGKYSIYTNMQYNPIFGLQGSYFPKEVAAKLLLDKGFIKVKTDFSQHNIEDIREIKYDIPQGWIDNFNLWANYTG